MATDEMLIRAAIRDEISGPLERIRDELQGTARDVDKASKKANIGARSFDKMAGGAGRFVKAGIGVAAKAAAAGIAAVSAAAVVGGAKVLQMASDAAETASAFKTVFKGVDGDVGGYLDSLSSRFGVVKADLQQAATNFGVFGKAAGVSKKELGGFTKDLTGAGLDLASFYNQDPTEVFTALRSGLAGEAEPLRQFGIFLSDAAMKAEAATMGMTGELTESQKVMVRQRLIMKSLGDAAGDMERTQDGLANKLKAIKGRFTEAGTAIGTAMLPYAERAARALDARLGPAVDRLPGKLKLAESAIKDYAGAWQSGGIDGVVGKIDAQVGAGGKLEDAWDKVKQITDDLATLYTDALKPAFDDVAGAVPLVTSPVLLLDDALGFLADNADLVRVALTGYIAAITIAKAVTVAHTAVTAISSAIMVARVGIHALLTGSILTNTGAELTRNQALAASIAIHLRLAGALLASAARTVASTVATVASTIAQKAARGAALAWAAAQWLVNAAMTANPIGLVVALIAGLVIGVVVAYKKVGWFRDGVDALWGALKTAGKWVADLVVKVGKFLLKWTPMGAAITLVKDNFDSVVSAVKKVIEWLGKIKMPKALSAIADGVGKVAGKIPGLGDTATSRARGGGALGSTMAAHAQASAATGARPTITNALVGGGGHGNGSGDHQNGRALDLTGKGLARYGRYIRAQGGYAAFHGTGRGRHLHAVPAMGDTSSSRARSRATVGSASAGGVIIAEGAIRVEVNNPSSNVDVEAAVAAGIRAYVQEREERS